MSVKRIGVIGAGDLGRSIAWLAILGGFETTVEDIRPEALAQGVDWIRRRLDQKVEQGAIPADEAARALARLRTADRVEEVGDADLVIEAGAEEMELKIELFGILDKFARAEAILASASHSLPIAEMAEVTQRPERCIGMRFGEPFAETKRIELVCGPATSEETVATCREVGRRMGKETAREPAGVAEGKRE
jgi:3-hydroxybutyryl-CoA dehydrogenase